MPNLGFTRKIHSPLCKNSVTDLALQLLQPVKSLHCIRFPSTVAAQLRCHVEETADISELKYSCTRNNVFPSHLPTLTGIFCPPPHPSQLYFK